MTREERIAAFVGDLHPKAVNAMCGQLYPDCSVRLLGGDEFYFDELMAAAEKRHAAQQEITDGPTPARSRHDGA